MVNNDRVSNPKPQGVNGGGSSFERSIYGKCGKKHLDRFLGRTDGCFGYEKKDHKMRYCPTLLEKRRESKQAALDSPNPNVQRETVSM